MDILGLLTEPRITVVMTLPPGLMVTTWCLKAACDRDTEATRCMRCCSLNTFQGAEGVALATKVAGNSFRQHVQLPVRLPINTGPPGPIAELSVANGRGRLVSREPHKLFWKRQNGNVFHNDLNNAHPNSGQKSAAVSGSLRTRDRSGDDGHAVGEGLPPRGGALEKTMRPGRF